MRTTARPVRERWTQRGDAILGQYARLLSIALFAGGVIGMVFSPMPQKHVLFAAIPIGMGCVLAVFGLFRRMED